MGRNPVVGRQGPAYHAAVIPTRQKAKRLAVKQIRSGIGHAGHDAADARRRSASGITSRPSSSSNTASVRGMLFKVRHLVEVTPAEEDVMAMAKERRPSRSPCPT